MNVFGAIEHENYLFRAFGLRFYTTSDKKEMKKKQEAVVKIRCSWWDSLWTGLINGLFIGTSWYLALWSILGWFVFDVQVEALKTAAGSTLMSLYGIQFWTDHLSITFLRWSMVRNRHLIPEIYNSIHKVDLLLAKRFNLEYVNRSYGKRSKFVVVGIVSLALLLIYFNWSFGGALILNIDNVISILGTVYVNILITEIAAIVYLIRIRINLCLRIASPLSPPSLHPHSTSPRTPQINWPEENHQEAETGEEDEESSKMISIGVGQICEIIRLTNQCFGLSFLLVALKLLITTIDYCALLGFLTFYDHIQVAYPFLTMATGTCLLDLSAYFILTFLCHQVTTGLSSGGRPQSNRNKIYLQVMHSNFQSRFTALGLWNIDLRFSYSVRWTTLH